MLNSKTNCLHQQLPVPFVCNQKLNQSINEDVMKRSLTRVPLDIVAQNHVVMLPTAEVRHYQLFFDFVDERPYQDPAC